MNVDDLREYTRIDPVDLDTEELIDAILAWGAALHTDFIPPPAMSVSCLPFKAPHGCTAMLLRNRQEDGKNPDSPRHLSVVSSANGDETRAALESLFLLVREKVFEKSE